MDRIKVKLGLKDPIASMRKKISQALQINNKSDTSFKPQERLMLLNILRLGGLRIEDVMVPRADIIALDENETISELMRLFEKAGHSRIPIFKETLDDTVGMVHIKDLMQWVTKKANKSKLKSNNEKQTETELLDLKPVDLSRSISSIKIKREVLFVPPSMGVVDLLMRMQTTRVHLALVIDEYGGTDGLVSIEDLVEEIVGEIEDEHDNEEEAFIYQDPVHGLVANARTPIEDLEKRLDKTLILDKDDEVDTLGGLVFSLVGRIPVRGELVKHPAGIEFEVLEVDLRRIKRLKVHLTPKTKNISKKKPLNSNRQQ